MATKKTTKKAEETKKTETAAVKAEAKVEEKKVEKNPVAKKAEKKVEKKPAAKKAEKKPAAKKVEKKAEKKPAAKKPAKKAEKALIESAVKGLFFEYGEKQVDAAALAELAKADYKANGGKGSVRGIELYVKAEDNALYYVINGKDSGKVEL
ncbi:MAG: hypothetical protein IKE65_03985 [Clostridia bacterium]|nr:hypothetical protein [Clostridia bacterium]